MKVIQRSGQVGVSVSIPIVKIIPRITHMTAVLSEAPRYFDSIGFDEEILFYKYTQGERRVLAGHSIGSKSLGCKAN